jgi:hypothetical protein
MWQQWERQELHADFFIIAPGEYPLGKPRRKLDDNININDLQCN